MNNNNDSVSFPYPYEDINFLNEYSNRDETASELNLYSNINTSILGSGKTFENEKMYQSNSDSLINFVDGSLFGIKSKFEDEYTNELNLDSQINLDISVLLGNRKTFKVVSTLKYKSEREINKIIQSKNLNEDIKEKLYLNEDTRSKEVVQIWSELIFPKKRKRNKGNEKSFSKNIKDIKIHIEKHLLGRKRKNDDSERIRTEFDTYNITKKIKNKLIQYLILSINNLIQLLYSKEQINQMLSELHLPQLKSNIEQFKVILKISHDIYAKRTKRDDNLEFLRSSITKCLSNDISKRYKYMPSDANRLIISKLLQDEKNKDIFDFIFNKLKIIYWLYIFTYQKELDDYTKNSLSEEKLSIIRKSLIRIDKIDLIKNDKNSKNYFHCFSIIIYNLKDFLDNKEGRNRKKKLESKENKNNI